MQLLWKKTKLSVSRSWLIIKTVHKVLKADKVTFSTTGEGDVAVRKGLLELHKPGQVTWKLNLKEQKVRLTWTFKQILKAKSSKPSVHSVVTGLNQEPSLPATVTVEYDKGFPKVQGDLASSC